MYDSSEHTQIQSFITENNLSPMALLGTHAHIDHIFGNWWVKQIYQIPYYLHQDDVKMIDRSETMAALWNLAYTPSPQPDHFLNGGDTIAVGKDIFEVRYVPGHAPGHVIFINHTNKFAVVGDTIFQGSIGRTDLPGGNHQQLIEKIHSEIFTLPDDYTLFSGHGNQTSVGIEKNTNPFFN
jgi:glyoxylase-like metal-dependent hydrolase (beta-lactamase superfamily II)